MSKSTAHKNVVRINAGTWRSRLLKFPDAEGLRPTPERVRQTVFNWLGQDMTGKHCLDLFAGTGAFGFEALSRHAKQVVMIENAKVAYQALLQNKTLLQAEQASILYDDALQFLNRNTQAFDVIFCDPPYQKQWLDKLLPVMHAHLSADGVLYAEAEYAITTYPGWEIIKYSKAGHVHYHLLKSISHGGREHV
jgi:16S rRNA (guanine(966)-N(2))-methyltransferase RsmD